MRFFTDEVGLVLSNGAAYGQGGEGFVRMNIGCPRKMVKEALGRIATDYHQVQAVFSQLL